MFTEGSDVECTAWFSYAAELTGIYMEPVYMAGGGGTSVSERFPVQLFGTSTRATLSSAILKVRASQICDVSIADNRQVAWEVELSSTSQVSRG